MRRNRVDAQLKLRNIEQVRFLLVKGQNTYYAQLEVENEKSEPFIFKFITEEETE